MYSDTDAIDQSERIPCLAAGMDPRSLPHSPLESYLLSRIDGCTPWSTLCEIGGMSPELVDELLERWLSGGFLTVEAKRDNTGRLGGAGARETAIDPTLDISEELQQRILNLEAVLEDLNYFEVLGVERSVDARGIKRAYFKLSREFHPDRYFRRSLGSFGPRLERIFKKIVEAYELLHDPATRAEVERSLSSERSRAPEDRQERVVPDSRMASSVLRSSGTRFQHLSRLRESFRSSPGRRAASTMQLSWLWGSKTFQRRQPMFAWPLPSTPRRSPIDSVSRKSRRRCTACVRRPCSSRPAAWVRRPRRWSSWRRPFTIGPVMWN